MSQHPTPGEILRVAREQQGLKQSDVAKNLRLSAQTIIDIESDDYRHFTAEIYLRGHMRAYARLVDVDAATLFAAYDKMDIDFDSAPSISATMVSSITTSRAATRRSKRKTILWAGVSVLFILIIMVMFWWQEQSHHTTVSTKPVVLTKPVAKVSDNVAPKAKTFPDKKKKNNRVKKVDLKKPFSPDYSLSVVKN